VNGQTISYKQSFFVASDSKQPQMQQSEQSQTISGNDFSDLRQKLKDQTKDISIDLNSIEIDIDNFSISYKLGGEKIKVISLIYDNAGQLETRLISVKNQNPTLEVLEKGKSGNVDWAVSIILADEILKEEALPKKLKSDVEIEYHKNLNRQFWLNNHLKSGIRKNLLNLAKFYFKQLDLGVELKDVIFTGSLANYNYTDLSDIDIHIIIDYKKLTNDDEFAKEFFSNKRSIWADSNEIKVNGFPVEIYVQDVSQLDDKGMGSMYSLLDNKWIKKPKYKLPQVEKHLITTKVNKYLDILNKISMMDDSIKKVEAYNKVFEKMRTDRKKATQKEGEFSVDNLVFKVLRNKGVFDIIKNNKKEIVNNLFSMKTN
jgi:predicted nucleotidyltransferase